MTTAAWLVLLFPLVGTVVIALTGSALPERTHGVIGTLAIAAAFVSAIVMLVGLQGRGEEERQVVTVAYDYAKASGVDAQLSLLIDPLSVLMCLVVSGVSTLIHVYSFSYMRSDRGYSRFFAYLNFFVFSMLLLVLAGNFLLLIVGWAFVGAASYMLISYWYRRTTATGAGIKAFVINVLGDVGLVLGTFLVFRGTGSLDFLKTFAAVGDAFTVNSPQLVGGCLLLLVGAFAKSAQVPLHTWLPDAMEGPTPVSALIHAATMVTAGVYLIARMHPLFEQAPTAADVGAVVGCVTLLVAATIGLVVTDLKRVIAYSTMSQIGYMVMAVSSAAYSAGLFHLMTHAFFKALLFMAAGSVIAAMGNVQDLDRMGGFRKVMPFTYGCMIVGGLALAGIFPFAGLWSKDEIIADEFARGSWHAVLGVLGYVGAFMTAVYTFRMIFRAFWGDMCQEASDLEHGHEHHVDPVNPLTGEAEDTEVGFPGPEHHFAERAGGMKLAMGALAVLAIVGGFVQVPGVTDGLHSFLDPTFADSKLAAAVEPSEGAEWIGIVVGTLVGAAGIFVAYGLWVLNPERPAAIQARLSWLHGFFAHKWYFDELIDLVVVKPAAFLGRGARDVVEKAFVDGALVGGASQGVRALSALVRTAQSGYLRYYAGLLLVGVTGLGFYFLVSA